MAAFYESRQLSNSLSEFSWELYRKLGQDPSSNLFFSPYSIMAALAMTFAGARNNTAKQMSEVLKLGEVKDVHQAFEKLNEALLSPNELYTFRSANRLYAQNDRTFLEAFLKTTDVHYKASLYPVDFKTATEDARSVINSWVSQQTDGKIQDLIASGVLNPLTVFVLVNAVYFKGNWMKRFNPNCTSVRKFKVSPNEIVPVDMMIMKESFEFFEDKQKKCQVLMLPYVGNKLKMTIVLPNESVSLADIEAKISADVVSRWVYSCTKQEVNVSLPRFKLETSFVLNDQLERMGMTDLFDENKADLSGITGSNDLFMSKVIHKAFVEVNEEGTEAAAATAYDEELLCAVPSFIADRPFLFFICDTSSGSVLFLGRLVRPPKSSQKAPRLFPFS